MTGPSDRISRRTRRTPDALRAQILDAASELFLRDGYASTSIDAVIENDFSGFRNGLPAFLPAGVLV